MAELSPQDGFLVLGGILIGSATTYWIVNRRLKLKYNQIADDEIQEMKRHYRQKEMELLDLQKEMSEQPKPDLEIIRKATNRLGYTMAEQIAINEVNDEVERLEAEEAEQAAMEAEAAAQEEADEIDPPLPVSMIEDPPRGHIWNTNAEIRRRKPGRPFVISREEFEAEDAYDHVTLRYWPGDDVLSDEHDQPMHDRNVVVGEENLKRFGHGSDDPSIVFVRNPRLTLDYEILLEEGEYIEEIHGGLDEEELQHMDMRRRRPRFDDDDG